MQWTEVNEAVMGASFPQESNYPLLRARLSSGATATLIDATVSVWFQGQAWITAAAVLLGPHFPADEPTFSAVEVQVTGMDSVAGVGPISHVTVPRGPGAIAGTWCATGNPAAHQEWEDDEAVLSWGYALSASVGDAYFHRLLFSPHATVELYEPRRPLRSLIDLWVDPIRWIVSVATGRSETLSPFSVSGEDERHQDTTWQVYGSGITQQSFSSRQKDMLAAKSAVRAHADGVSLLAVLRAWQQLAAAKNPILETYGKAVGRLTDQPPRAQFLVLVQAIEGLYATEEKEKRDERIAKHQQQRDELLQRLLTDPNLGQQDRRFLNRSLSKYPPSGLLDGLLWSEKMVPGELGKRLDGTALIAAVRAEEGAPTWATCIQVVRNHLSHGDRGYDPYLLHAVVKLLDGHVRAHILRLLGCGEESQKRAAMSED
jgi:hypothetical protein